MEYNKLDCEFLRHQAKQKFDKVKTTWLDAGRWTLPHRIRWMEGRFEQGERSNQHIVDSTHLLAHRSYVAGFLEGNTSATRPWFRQQSNDPELNLVPENHAWLDKFTRRCLYTLSSSNFYHAAAMCYSDYGVFNTAAYFIDEFDTRLFFHVLVPGSYFVINDALGEAVVLVMERSLTVKALVEEYGPKQGKFRDWSNISDRTRKLYEEGNYTHLIDIVTVVKENPDFDPEKPQVLLNRKWIRLTYEIGNAAGGTYYAAGLEDGGVDQTNRADAEVFLRKSASKRKPFIVAAGERSSNFEYGEKGPTTDALGLIKSLNKKAIGKDQALEQMLRPALQGPAQLRKSYITSAANSFIPLDPSSLAQKGLRTIFEINPAIGSIIQDVSDLRQQVEKFYYADFLLFLSQNPKTRTATETQEIVQEKQLVIGPNLQSLNFTHNIPVMDFVMDFTLDTDPFLEPPPEALTGTFLKTDFISVFAQAQKAADLPAVERWLAMITNVGQLNPKIFDKVNFDKISDLYEDRLFLPAGLNNPQAKVDAQREQAQAMAQRQQAMTETMPALAKSVKDLGSIKP